MVKSAKCYRMSEKGKSKLCWGWSWNNFIKEFELELSTEGFIVSSKAKVVHEGMGQKK